MSDLSLKRVNTGPSHYNIDDKDFWIDTIFIDNCDSAKSYNRLLPTFPSRYEISSVTIDLFYSTPPDVKQTYRALSKITAHDLNAHLKSLEWSAFLTTEDNFNIEQGLSTLTDNIHKAIDKLAPEKKLNKRKVDYPWINSELKLLRLKRDATSRRYTRTVSRSLLNEFLALANSYEEKSETAHCAYMHNRICSTLDENGNFWKEMKTMGLIPKASDALHGFLPDELNLHFSKIAISPNEDPLESINIVNNAPTDGFVFKRIPENDVILVVSHFNSQAKGDDDIPPSVIVKVLPSIVSYLTKLFNTSLLNGIFPYAWKKSRILAL